LLFLVHCDRPFVGPVYEVILALVRNVRNGSKSDMLLHCGNVCFAPESGYLTRLAKSVKEG
jgi:hypothetical protein